MPSRVEGGPSGLLAYQAEEGSARGLCVPALIDKGAGRFELCGVQPVGLGASKVVVKTT
ncbi:hypothetical protein GCM10017673_20180 [Streptosporangium violaceochromogenes]|nr:hypothetical protein GCM10017673_20180 [Streptosporangium violaceochromogenes]